MQKWEYKLVNGWLTEDQLEDLGTQGWELVTTVVGMGNRNMAFYFKRPAGELKTVPTVDNTR